MAGALLLLTGGVLFGSTAARQSKALGGLLGYRCSIGKSGSKPNLLFLFPDQWRGDWDGRHTNYDGSPLNLKIPTIRALAANGSLFSNAYVAAPVCAPSRSCLASGREYDKFGAQCNASVSYYRIWDKAGVACNFCNDFPVATEKTFYNQLQDAGYHTMVTGKDDLTKKSQPGIDGDFHRVELGFSDGLRASGKMDVVSSFPQPHEPYGVFLNATVVPLSSGVNTTAWLAHAACMGKGDKALCETGTFPGSTYEDNWTAENAKTLIRRRPAGQPFFIQVNFPGPHPPFLITTEMMGVEVGNTFTAGIDANASNSTFRCAAVTGPDVNPEQSAEARCDYAAEIENIDARMHDIIELVRGQGVYDNTIVVFGSDHGTMLGDHGDSGKTMPWEGSAHVPLIVSGPAVRAAAVLPTPVSIMDLAATFIDYGGAALAPGMTSVSMRPLFEGTAESVRSFIHSGLQQSQFGTDHPVPDNEYTRGGGSGGTGFNWRMVVKRYNESMVLKFICCKDQCNGEPSTVPEPVNNWTQLLYNTVTDPFDMNPLTNDPSYALEMANLRSLLPTSEWTCGE